MSLLNIDDFQPIVTQLSVVNHTSSVPIGRSPEVQLLEVDSSGLVLTFPESRCAVGHHLGIHLRVSAPRIEPMEFSFTAKVSLVEKGGGEGRVSVSLVQFEAEKWESFLNLYARRQEEILLFFKSVRGLE